MSAPSDDQIRDALARRSQVGLTEEDRANVLRAARLRALQPRRRWMPRFAAWIAAAAAIVVLVVIAVPVLLSSPVPVARASSSPPPGSPSPVPIYSGPQLAAMVGDPNWIGKTVLSDATIDGHNGPGPACMLGQPCYVGNLDGLVTPIEVWADWRDTLPGKGTPVASDYGTQWLTEVGMPSTASIAAFRIDQDYVVLLGPAQLDHGQAWHADKLAAQAGKDASDDVYVVSGWMLQAGPMSCPVPADYAQTPQPDREWYCGGTWITAAEHRSIFHDTPNSGHIVSAWDDGVQGQNGAYDQFAVDPATDDQGSIPRYGTYLMRNAGCQQETMGNCPVWRIVGRIDPGNPPDIVPAPTVTPLVLTTRDLGDVSIDLPDDWTVTPAADTGQADKVLAFITAPGSYATQTCGSDYDPDLGGPCIDKYVIPSLSALIVVSELNSPPDAVTAIDQAEKSGWQSAELAGHPAAYRSDYSGGTTPAGVHSVAWLVAGLPTSGTASSTRFLITVSDMGMNADFQQLVQRIVGSLRFQVPEATSSASTIPEIRVSNGTTLRLDVAINGKPLGTSETGSVNLFDPSTFPEPWTVTVTTESGRQLVDLRYELSDIGTSMGGTNQEQGAFVGQRVDLSCGRLDVSVGSVILGPTFVGSFPPNDCAP